MDGRKPGLRFGLALFVVASVVFAVGSADHGAQRSEEKAAHHFLWSHAGRHHPW